MGNRGCWKLGWERGESGGGDERNVGDRVGIRGIGVEMPGIGVGMRGYRVGMRKSWLQCGE